jgi:hypothetical protein
MSTTAIVAEELLERATVLAESERNLEMMDRATLLHVYLELARLDPNNGRYRKDVEDAAMRLQELICTTRELIAQPILAGDRGDG